MENTYTINVTERQLFLLTEGVNKLTDTIWHDIPRVLSDGLCEAVKSVDVEIDAIRHILVNAQPEPRCQYCKDGQCEISPEDDCPCSGTQYEQSECAYR